MQMCPRLNVSMFSGSPKNNSIINWSLSLSLTDLTVLREPLTSPKETAILVPAEAQYVVYHSYERLGLSVRDALNPSKTQCTIQGLSNANTTPDLTHGGTRVSMRILVSVVGT